MAVIETHENNAEITDNEVVPRTDTDQSANKANGNPPNVATCDANNGGCDQICNMVQNEHGDALVAECSCSLGYYLDLDEGKHCIGKCSVGIIFFSFC